MMRANWLRLTGGSGVVFCLVVGSCSGKATRSGSSDNAGSPATAGQASMSEGGTGGASEVPLCSDPMSCGECGDCVADASSDAFTVGFGCDAGKCVASCYEGTGDCDENLGCETFVNTADNCGQCGQKACAVANTLLTCSAGDQACTSPVCEPGFANCNQDGPDCETALGAVPSCFPGYVDTIKHHTRSVYPVAAMAPDGSLFLGGDLDETDDFDPTSGVDQRSPGPSGMAYITKLNPDGSYAWTRTFDADFLLNHGLAADADGVVAVGTYHGSVDFDPGAGVAVQTASGNGNTGDSFVVKLTQAGEYSWAYSLAPGDQDGRVSASSVVLSGGDVYVGGGYSGSVDFDQGPGESVLSTVGSEQAFVTKLDSSGGFAWVRGLQGDACSGWVLAMTAAPNGLVWVAGSREGPCSFTSDAPQPGAGAYVAAFSDSGEVAGEWALAEAADDARSIAAAADGSIFVGGVFFRPEGGEIDIDPGAGVDRRSLVPGSTGFITKLEANGAYVWSQLMGSTAVTVAATPDGGLLASGLLPDLRFVSKLGADGTAEWSLGFFQGGNDFQLVAGMTSFVVAGVVDDGSSVDFDPSLGVVEAGFEGQTTFFSRFTY